MAGATLVINSIAFILIFLGAFIWKTRAVELVAGYEPEKTTDPEGLARCIGINMIAMGALVLAGNFLGVLFPGIPFEYKLGFILLAIAVFTVRAVAQCRKFERDE